MKIKMPMSWLHKQKKRKPTLWNEPSLISSWIRRKIPDPFAFNKDIVQPKSKYDNFAFEMEKEKLFTEISEKCKEEYFSNATRSRIVHEILDNDQITTFPGSSENEYDGVRSVVHQIMKKKRCTDADLRKIVHQIMKQKSCTVEDLRRSVHQIMEKKLCTDEDLRRIVHEILDKEQITTVSYYKHQMFTIFAFNDVTMKGIIH
ncbi:uncharacterized protein [Apostichopus japonicus]|uniref:uncharacterized protein n=1 Tax=Stichopus japonicus TaxID=307972 RepID=UPI003AB8FDFC